MASMDTHGMAQPSVVFCNIHGGHGLFTLLSSRLMLHHLLDFTEDLWGHLHPFSRKCIHPIIMEDPGPRLYLLPQAKQVALWDV